MSQKGISLGTFAAGGAVGAIVALFISMGFEGILQRLDKAGDTIISGVRPSDQRPISVKIQNNTIISPQFIFKRITTTRTTKRNDDDPDLEIKNEASTIKRVFTIAIVPDPTFQAEGQIQISINDVTFFPAILAPTQGDFQDITAINVPIPDTYGLRLLPDNKLKVFIFNPSGNLVAATIAIFIGELP